MIDVRASLVAIAHDRDALSAPWAVIGGLAVSARAEPRLTRDVDIAVAVHDDIEAERLVADLRDRGYAVEAIVEQTATRRLATVRMAPPRSGAVVDLLFASSGIERDLVGRADRIEVAPGLTLPVAQRGDLIALKLLARDDGRRPQGTTCAPWWPRPRRPSSTRAVGGAAHRRSGPRARPRSRALAEPPARRAPARITDILMFDSLRPRRVRSRTKGNPGFPNVGNLHEFLHKTEPEVTFRACHGPAPPRGRTGIGCSRSPPVSPATSRRNRPPRQATPPTFSGSTSMPAA
jgi:hypothetical protein